MTDKDTGWLEVDWNGEGEIIVTYPHPEKEEDDRLHVPLTPAQARNLARSLLRFSEEAELSEVDKLVRKGWEEGEPRLSVVTLEPDDPQGLPGEKCFLVKLTVPMTCWPVRKDGTPFEPDPPGLWQPQRWRQEVVFRVGLFSGMWSVAENGMAPTTTVLLPR